MNKMRFLSLPLLAALFVLSFVGRASAQMDYITTVGNAGNYFVDQTNSNTTFTPWGIAYEPGNCSVINDMQTETGTWTTGTSGGTQTQQDLQYDKSLGVNVVRFNIQFGDLMTISSGTAVTISATGSNGNGLTPVQSLTRLLNYCATLGIHASIEFCAVILNDPPGYTTSAASNSNAPISQTTRWGYQAAWWTAVANAVHACTYPDVLCYYALTGEPEIPTTTQISWYSAFATPASGGGYVTIPISAMSNTTPITVSTTSTSAGWLYFASSVLIAGVSGDPNVNSEWAISNVSTVGSTTTFSLVNSHATGPYTVTGATIGEDGGQEVLFTNTGYPTNSNGTPSTAANTVAYNWASQMRTAIHSVETGGTVHQHMITVAMLYCTNLSAPYTYCGNFAPSGLASTSPAAVDFQSVHNYPGQLSSVPATQVQYGVAAVNACVGYGLPVMIEEWAPISGESPATASQIIEQTATINGGSNAGNLAWYYRDATIPQLATALPMASGTTLTNDENNLWELELLEDPMALGFEEAVQGSPLLSITGVTYSTGYPILVTTSGSNAYYVNTQSVTISGVRGCTAANGTWAVTNQQSITHYAGVSGSGSVVDITVSTSTANPFTTGDTVTISGSNESSLNGTWTITRVSGTDFTLNGSSSDGTSGSGSSSIYYPATATDNSSFTLNSSTGNAAYTGGGTAKQGGDNYDSITPTDPWTYTSQGGGDCAGVVASASNWTTAPQGSQVGFLDGTGIIGQSFYFKASTAYTITFKSAQASWNAGPQAFYVEHNGTAITGGSAGSGGLFQPTGTGSYATYTTGSYTPSSSGFQTLSFVGTSAAGDIAFLDSISISPTDSPH